jgi:hypothetical protein
LLTAQWKCLLHLPHAWLQLDPGHDRACVHVPCLLEAHCRHVRAHPSSHGPQLGECLLLMAYSLRFGWHQ